MQEGPAEQQEPGDASDGHYGSSGQHEDKVPYPEEGETDFLKGVPYGNIEKKSRH